MFMKDADFFYFFLTHFEHETCRRILIADKNLFSINFVI